MTGTAGSTTPAGWYTDPGGSGHLRWWDGASWTAHLAPQPTPAPAPTPVVPAAPVEQAPIVPRPVDPGLATASGERYVPFQGSWNTNSQGASYSVGSVGDFARPAQWNTVGSWLLAFSGLLSSVAVLIVFATAGTSITTPFGAGRYFGAAAVVFLVIVLFAEADRRKLRSLGYLSVPSLWWMLLAAPLAYLIVRTVKVYGEVRRGIAPLITYFVVNVVSGILVGVAIAVLLPGVLGATSSAAFASSLQTGLNQNGGHYTVTCPPTLSITVGANFTCTAIDVSGVSHELSITIVRGADGQPTAKLLSVVPPITQ
jgi:hypothetical protein